MGIIRRPNGGAKAVTFGFRGEKSGLLLVLVLAAACASGTGQTSTDATIQSLQTHLKMYPQDFKAYDALGASYIQKGRETADASYYELAKEALDKSLDLVANDPAAASAKTHMAVVAMAEHQFQEALSWAQAALALGSGDPSPWAIVGDALTDLGEYERADEAYGRLRDPLRDESSGLAYERNSRMAYLHFLRGDASGAVKLMRTAITVAMTLHLPVENVAWSQYQLGDICFKSGDLIGAEQAYRAGLDIDPHSYRNLAGLGEVRTAQGRYPEAIALYRKAIAVVPFPSFAAAIYDLDLQVGHPDDAHKQLALLEFISTLNPLNERLFYRELALFYADHDFKLKESVELAKKELEVRHDIYTWDIMAWVLFKNGRAPEAAEAVEKALALGTGDALLDFHAGMIASQLGHNERARTMFRRALTLNPQFHLVYAGQAREKLGQLADSAAVGETYGSGR
ncbi:MAG: tetratricopeptide repeat protein [Terriglobia bacterium]|jgi:tetratricopeptide (TPR) repeat protein